VHVNMYICVHDGHMVYVCMRGIRCILIREGHGCVHMMACVYVGGMGVCAWT
jgi:hypothetical protein